MLFTLGEVAAGVAMSRMLAAEQPALRSITHRATIEYRKPARGAITAATAVAVSRDQIVDALREQRSIDVPITVTLTDDAAVTVATLAVDWYVGRARP